MKVHECKTCRHYVTFSDGCAKDHKLFYDDSTGTRNPLDEVVFATPCSDFEQ
ncbi:MAG: hypothetical protein HWN66_08740 [Candidatus Helarchaeota archaeon]|nr:hypothetical protein [Candidatus Helarchaeota archaeon]